MGGITHVNISGTGGINLTASGTNQNIVLTSSGTGYVSIPGSSNGLLVAGNVTTGVNRGFRAGNVALMRGDSGSLELAMNARISWSDNSGDFTTHDTLLARDAAGILAQRNGSAAQTQRTYNNYTSATVFERGTFGFPIGTNRLRIGTEFLGAGMAALPIDFVTGDVVRMSIAAAGNVGIGTAVPTSRLHVQATGVAFTRESILKCTLSDSGNDVFEIFNGTSIDGRFVPSFSGANFSNSASNCLSFLGQTVSGNDIGTSALVTFIARITASQTDPNNSTFTDVANRPLFYWANWATPVMQILANGNLGIGTTSPTSKLQVSAGDIEVDTITKGLILKSPDGTRYRVTVPNGGTVLTITAV
jgi:hypothetical protein